MHNFAAALKDVNMPIPDGMVAWHGHAIDKRFAVYRNNIYAGLVDALAAQFPVTLQIVGEEFFRDMALLYARAHLPTSPTLFTYGADFAQFITHFAPAHEMRYLAEMARFEYMWTCSYHAADAHPITAEALANVPPEVMGTLILKFHPSAQLFSSIFPIIDMWIDHKHECVGSREYRAGQFHHLIIRPQVDVLLIPIAPQAYACVAALYAGAQLGDAMALVPETAPPELAPTMLATLLGQGCIIDFTIHT